MKHKHSKYRIIIASLLIVALLTFILTGIFVSKHLKTSYYSLKSDLSAPICIVQISDLHYPKNSVSVTDITKQIVLSKPDVVAFTGDIIDGDASWDDMRYICQSFAEIAQKYSTFYILGNHEIGHPMLNEFILMLQDNHIILLSDELKVCHINDNKIAIIGLNDGKKLNNDNVVTLPAKASCQYSILLAHRPELLQNYSKENVNLVLSGHTHGGQARLLKQGLYAPNQGLFPKYSHGMYKCDNTTMLVCSGLSGKGRFYNPLEINVINIHP